MTDRFSKATEELAEKNAYVCETCNVESGRAVSGEYAASAEKPEERTMGEGLHVSGLDIGATRLERVIHSDPTPFGA